MAEDHAFRQAGGEAKVIAVGKNVRLSDRVLETIADSLRSATERATGRANDLELRKTAVLPAGTRIHSARVSEFDSIEMPPPGPDVISNSTNVRSLDGAVMASAGSRLVWWDREVDSHGQPIRSDVRSAGRDLWAQACRQTMAALGDRGPAAELMENAIAQVSRYLDRAGAPMSSRKHGLVMVAFRRALDRYRTKLSRLELVGGSHELSKCGSSHNWIAQADVHLELERLVRRLSPRNAEILMLRAAGFEWREIASLFSESSANLRNRFWREIGRLW